MNYKIKARPKIPRNKYGYLAPSSTGGAMAVIGNNTITTQSDGTASRLQKPVNIWGQPFDGSEDVDGDITVNGNATITKELIVKQGARFNGDVYVDGELNLQGNSLTQVDEIYVEGNSYLQGATNTENVYPMQDNTYNLGTATKRYKNIHGINAILDKLTVTGEAHFFKLIIDEVKAAGGQLILSAADFTVDKVDAPLGNILPWGNGITQRLYQRATDESGRKILNKCLQYDLMRCQTFNVDGNNKYYWATVIYTGSINVDGVDYNYIDLVADGMFDGVLNPAVGDELVLLGNMVNPSRQSAIIISAYNNIDSSVSAPSIVQYQGINSFETPLSQFQVSVISANGNVFKGDVEADSFSISTPNSIMRFSTLDEITYDNLPSEIKPKYTGKLGLPIMLVNFKGDEYILDMYQLGKQGLYQYIAAPLIYGTPIKYTTTVKLEGEQGYILYRLIQAPQIEVWKDSKDTGERKDIKLLDVDGTEINWSDKVLNRWFKYSLTDVPVWNDITSDEDRAVGNWTYQINADYNDSIANSSRAYYISDLVNINTYAGLVGGAAYKGKCEIWKAVQMTNGITTDTGRNAVIGHQWRSNQEINPVATETDEWVYLYYKGTSRNGWYNNRNVNSTYWLESNGKTIVAVSTEQLNNNKLLLNNL